MKLTQTDRLVAFLREHPDSSSLELTLALGIVNTTGRISDARKEGQQIVCERGKDGVQRYALVVAPSQRTLGLTA